MYIVKIIPIAKGLPENYFSYFSKENISIGTLVEIKIRNRKLMGIVSSINEVKNEKINLKTQNYSLKKIERVVKENFIEEKLFKSIIETAILIGAKESEILDNYLPEFFFENINLFIKNNEDYRIKKNKIHTKKSNPDLLVEDIIERFEKYNKKIKSNLNNNQSTVIFFPTINDIEYAAKYFKKNLAKENILILHSKQTKKEIKEHTEKINNSNTLVILSTPSILPFVLKENINLFSVIIEKENSFNYYSNQAKRQIDSRELLKKLAQDIDLDITLGGNILSLESYQKASNSIEIKKCENRFLLIDLVKEKENSRDEIKNRSKRIKEESNEYSKIYFADKFVQELENIKKNKKGKIFIYTKRKGLASETICSDCNSVFKCNKCERPYTLFKENKDKDRVYICTSCKDKIQLNKNKEFSCKNCGSWRMQTLGVGVEGIEENLKKAGWNTYILDSKNIKNKKEAIQIIDSWQKEKMAILVGTDLALNFLNRDMNIDLAGIISIDSLFSIPEINIDEKIMSLALDIDEKCNYEGNILIETRLRDNEIWEYIINADKEKFLKEELELRNQLSLPPYSVILKFNIEKKNLKVKNNLEKILDQIFKEERLKPLNIGWKIEKKTESHIGIIIVDRKYWETKDSKNNLTPTNFAKKIHTLLTDFRLEINPQNVY